MPPGCVASSAAIFAVSIDEPPPSPTKPSKPPSRATATARLTDASFGSIALSANTSTSTPASRIAATTGSIRPIAARCGSVTTRARVTPALRRCHPVSSAAPGPNTSGVPATVKTLSFTLTESRPIRPCRGSR